MGNRPSAWVIREQREGPYTVWQDRRRVMEGRNLGELIRVCQKSLKDGDTLQLQEADGYRVPISGRRRRWRAALHLT